MSIRFTSLLCKLHPPRLRLRERVFISDVVELNLFPELVIKPPDVRTLKFARIHWSVLARHLEHVKASWAAHRLARLELLELDCSHSAVAVRTNDSRLIYHCA